MTFEDILGEIRQKILQKRYIVTVHADEEMDDDNLAIADLERIIETGKIIERQRDRNTGEWKYRIRGYSTDDVLVEVIVKLGITGKVVIITVYAI